MIASLCTLYTLEGTSQAADTNHLCDSEAFVICKGTEMLSRHGGLEARLPSSRKVASQVLSCCEQNCAREGTI